MTSQGSFGSSVFFVNNFRDHIEVESRESHEYAGTELPNRMMCDLTLIDQSVALEGVT